MRGRDLGLPLLVAVAVTLFVGYLWFQGRAQTSEFAVTSAHLGFMSADDARLAESLRENAPAEQLMVVDVSWEAADAIDGGSYYVLVAAPNDWTNYACDPSCDWSSTPDLQQFAGALPRATFPEGAQFDAEETGHVQVAFAPLSSASEVDPEFEPAAWLVQTDGANVLEARRIQ